MTAVNVDFQPFAARMRAEHLPDIVIRTFEHYYQQLAQGETGLIPESDIRPIESLPDLEQLPKSVAETGRAALSKTVLSPANKRLIPIVVSYTPTDTCGGVTSWLTAVSSDPDSGTSGGDVPNATYRNHGTHAEAIEVVFDPTQLGYRELLEFFFQVHDPTTRNRQGNDVGTQYRSVIFCHSAAQEAAARASLAREEQSGRYSRPIVTQITMAGPFWRAEEYHQQYLARRGGGSCHF